MYLLMYHMIYALFDAIPRSQKQLQRWVQVRVKHSSFICGHVEDPGLCKILESWSCESCESLATFFLLSSCF